MQTFVMDANWQFVLLGALCLLALAADAHASVDWQRRGESDSWFSPGLLVAAVAAALAVMVLALIGISWRMFTLTPIMYELLLSAAGVAGGWCFITIRRLARATRSA